MKRWHWWALAIVLALLTIAIFAANRYTLQCVATNPPELFRGMPLTQCYVLDRWTGEVRRAP